MYDRIGFRRRQTELRIILTLLRTVYEISLTGS